MQLPLLRWSVRFASSSAKHPFAGATSPVSSVGGVKSSPTSGSGGITAGVAPPMSIADALKLWSKPVPVRPSAVVASGGANGGGRAANVPVKNSTGSSSTSSIVPGAVATAVLPTTAAAAAAAAVVVPTPPMSIADALKLWSTPVRPPPVTGVLASGKVSQSSSGSNVSSGGAAKQGGPATVLGELSGIPSGGVGGGGGGGGVKLVMNMAATATQAVVINNSNNLAAGGGGGGGGGGLKRFVASSGLAAIREEMQKNRRLQAERRLSMEEERRASWAARQSRFNGGNSSGSCGGSGSYSQSSGSGGKQTSSSSSSMSGGVVGSSPRVGSFSSAFGTAGGRWVTKGGAADGRGVALNNNSGGESGGGGGRALASTSSTAEARRRSGIYSERQLFSSRPLRGTSSHPRDSRGRLLRIKRAVSVTDGMTVRELASALGFSRDRIFSALNNAGETLTKVTDIIDGDVAELIASEAGAKVTRVADPRRDRLRTEPPSSEDLAAAGAPFRAPIVTVMGHVDHGKTSLLDALRGASVAAKEAGGITQGISAFSVAMRAAAQATGIVRAPGGKAARKAAASAENAANAASEEAAEEKKAAEAILKSKNQTVVSTTSITTTAVVEGAVGGRGRRTAAAVKVALRVNAAKTAANKLARIAARNSAVAAATAARAAGEIPIASTDVITFLDTPGHALFASMRRQGSSLTDVVVLVVDGTAGVQPQTKECVRLILESQVPCVVGVTKCDVADKDAAVRRIASELLKEGLVTEADGGDVPIVAVSARSGLGLEDLKALITLQAEAGGLRSRVDAPGEAAVLDSRIAQGLGQVVDAVVRWGTLRVGDVIVAGHEVGRIKALLTDSVAAASLARRLSGGGGGKTGKNKEKDSATTATTSAATFKMMPVREALPGTPVRVVGLKGAPAAGEDLLVVESEERGKAIVEGRMRRAELADAVAIAAADAVMRAGAHAEYKRRQARRVALALATSREKKRAALRRAGQPIPERLLAAPWETAIMEEIRSGAMSGVSAGGRLQRVQGGQQLDAPLSFADATASAIGGEKGLATARATPVVALILRADSVGALSALQAAIARIPLADARVLPRVVQATVGDFTEKDVVYASEFKAALIGFGAAASPAVGKAAERARVVLKAAPVIYHVLDFLLEHLADALPAEDVEGIISAAEVKTVFSLRKGSDVASVIAGCAIVEGEFKMGANKYRVMRDGEILHETKSITSLQHLKERVTSVVKGRECGIGLGEFTDFKAGDRIVAIGVTKRKQVIKVGWG